MSDDEFGFESLGTMRVLAITERAICFDDPSNPTADDLWVPKSVLEDPSIFTEQGDEDEVFVRQWWYEREIA